MKKFDAMTLALVLILGVTLGVSTAYAGTYPEEKRVERERIVENNLDEPSILTVYLKPIKLAKPTTAALYDTVKVLVEEYVTTTDCKTSSVQFFFKMVGDPTDTTFSLSFKYTPFTSTNISTIAKVLLECYNHGAGTDPTRWDVPYFIRHKNSDIMNDSTYECVKTLNILVAELRNIESVMNLTREMKPYQVCCSFEIVHVYAGEMWNNNKSLIDKEGFITHIDYSWYKDESEYTLEGPYKEYMERENGLYAQMMELHNDYVKKHVKGRKWDGKHTLKLK